MYAIIKDGHIQKISSEYPKRFLTHIKIGSEIDQNFKAENCKVVETNCSVGTPLSKVIMDRRIETPLTWENFKAYQIFFDEVSKHKTYEPCIKVENEKGGKYFENKVIMEVYLQGTYGDGYVTFLSSSDKFRFKTGNDIELVRLKISQDNCRNDVYCFGDLGWDNVWKIGDDIHGDKFTEIGQELFHLLGYDVNLHTLDTLGIYSNFWVARAKIFEKYVSEFLLPAYYYMEHDLRDLVDCECPYPSNAKRDDINYTWHTFIMERLFTTFCTLNNIIPVQI